MNFSSCESSNELAPRMWLVVPCFYDYASFCELRKRAIHSIQSARLSLNLCFVLVDDTGGQDSDLIHSNQQDDVLVLRAPYNLGHQGALVYALRRLAPVFEPEDFIVTMDSDGEDKPEDIPALIEPLRSARQELTMVSLAQRTKRNESWLFKVCYFCFKLLFSWFTGTVVRNGNFAAYRGWFAKHVLFHPYFDYCYSSSLLALAQNLRHVPLARGVRYYGRSKMTWVSLIGHGFRMLLPFVERIAIRLIVACFLLCLLSLCIAAAAIYFCMVGAQLALWLGIICACAFAWAMILASSCCLFFVVSNQTRATSLRTLTGGTIQEFVAPPVQELMAAQTDRNLAATLR